MPENRCVPRTKKTLQAIIDNANISEEEKKDAIAQMLQMTQLSEQEVAVETLMASKGFSESVVSLTADSADIVVNAAELTDANRAQIEDIVTRKTNIAPEKIVITPIHETAEAKMKEIGLRQRNACDTLKGHVKFYRTGEEVRCQILQRR